MLKRAAQEAAAGCSCVASHVAGERICTFEAGRQGGQAPRAAGFGPPRCGRVAGRWLRGMRSAAVIDCCSAESNQTTDCIDRDSGLCIRTISGEGYGLGAAGVCDDCARDRASRAYCELLTRVRRSEPDPVILEVNLAPFLMAKNALL